MLSESSFFEAYFGSGEKLLILCRDSGDKNAVVPKITSEDISPPLPRRRGASSRNKLGGHRLLFFMRRFFLIAALRAAAEPEMNRR